MRQSSASRTMSETPMPGWRKACLCYVVMSSVPPAKEKYSPPEREVGMHIRGTDAGLTFWGGGGFDSTE